MRGRLCPALAALTLVLVTGCQTTVTQFSPQTFPAATAWVHHHVRSAAKIRPTMVVSGLGTAPNGQLTVIWTLPPGTVILLSGGRVIRMPTGGDVRLVIRLHDPSYLGPVYLQKAYHKPVAVLNP